MLVTVLQPRVLKKIVERIRRHYSSETKGATALGISQPHFHRLYCNSAPRRVRHRLVEQMRRLSKEERGLATLRPLIDEAFESRDVIDRLLIHEERYEGVATAYYLASPVGQAIRQVRAWLLARARGVTIARWYTIGAEYAG